MPRTEQNEKDERRETQPRHENRRTDSPGHTPGKAEGEERDIDEALRSSSTEKNG
jgi:hypothetical protein